MSGEEDTEDLLSPPSEHGEKRNAISPLEVRHGDGYGPVEHDSSSCAWHLATLRAYSIIYRNELLLGTVLLGSIVVAVTSFIEHHRVDPFEAAKIATDYSYVQSKFDLTLGQIDHWCLRGGDDKCRCEDPLEPMPRKEMKGWMKAHKANIELIDDAVGRTAVSGAWDVEAPYDDAWLEHAADDDWVYGEGPKYGVYDEDDYDDMIGNYGGDDSPVDVVFLGDSITEQRVGRAMGREMDKYTSIKEIFHKQFTVADGGKFNGLALGIAGDTAPNLLWRMMNGEMPTDLNPKVWWIGIGTNDLGMAQCSEEVVLLGILRLVEEIQNQKPDATIVINSILPIAMRNSGLLETAQHHAVSGKALEKVKSMQEENPNVGRAGLWPSIVSINAELEKFASQHKNVKFFDANKIFVKEESGAKYLNEDLMIDPVHPNDQGHKLWGKAIITRLEAILGSRR